MGESKSCEGNNVNHCTRSSSLRVSRLSTCEGVRCWTPSHVVFCPRRLLCPLPHLHRDQHSQFPTKHHAGHQRALFRQGHGVFAAVMRETATSWRQKIQLSSSVEEGPMMGAGQKEQAEGEDKSPSCLPAMVACLRKGLEVFTVSRACVANRRKWLS